MAAGSMKTKRLSDARTRCVQSVWRARDTERGGEGRGENKAEHSDSSEQLRPEISREGENQSVAEIRRFGKMQKGKIQQKIKLETIKTLK